MKHVDSSATAAPSPPSLHTPLRSANNTSIISDKAIYSQLSPVMTVERKRELFGTAPVSNLLQPYSDMYSKKSTPNTNNMSGGALQQQQQKRPSTAGPWPRTKGDGGGMKRAQGSDSMLSPWANTAAAAATSTTTAGGEVIMTSKGQHHNSQKQQQKGNNQRRPHTATAASAQYQQHRTFQSPALKLYKQHLQQQQMRLFERKVPVARILMQNERDLLAAFKSGHQKLVEETHDYFSSEEEDGDDDEAAADGPPSPTAKEKDATVDDKEEKSPETSKIMADEVMKSVLDEDDIEKEEQEKLQKEQRERDAAAEQQQQLQKQQQQQQQQQEEEEGEGKKNDDDEVMQLLSMIGHYNDDNSNASSRASTPRSSSRQNTATSAVASLSQQEPIAAAAETDTPSGVAAESEEPTHLNVELALARKDTAVPSKSSEELRTTAAAAQVTASVVPPMSPELLINAAPLEEGCDAMAAAAASKKKKKVHKYAQQHRDENFQVEFHMPETSDYLTQIRTRSAVQMTSDVARLMRDDVIEDRILSPRKDISKSVMHHVPMGRTYPAFALSWEKSIEHYRLSELKEVKDASLRKVQAQQVARSSSIVKSVNDLRRLRSNLERTRGEGGSDEDDGEGGAVGGEAFVIKTATDSHITLQHDAYLADSNDKNSNKKSNSKRAGVKRDGSAGPTSPLWGMFIEGDDREEEEDEEEDEETDEGGTTPKNKTTKGERQHNTSALKKLGSSVKRRVSTANLKIEKHPGKFFAEIVVDPNTCVGAGCELPVEDPQNIAIIEEEALKHIVFPSSGNVRADVVFSKEAFVLCLHCSVDLCGLKALHSFLLNVNKTKASAMIPSAMLIRSLGRDKVLTESPRLLDALEGEFEHAVEKMRMKERKKHERKMRRTLFLLAGEDTGSGTPKAKGEKKDTPREDDGDDEDNDDEVEEEDEESEEGEIGVAAAGDDGETEEQQKDGRRQSISTRKSLIGTRITAAAEDDDDEGEAVMTAEDAAKMKRKQLVASRFKNFITRKILPGVAMSSNARKNADTAFQQWRVQRANLPKHCIIIAAAQFTDPLVAPVPSVPHDAEALSRLFQQHGFVVDVLKREAERSCFTPTWKNVQRVVRTAMTNVDSKNSIVAILYLGRGVHASFPSASASKVRLCLCEDTQLANLNHKHTITAEYLMGVTDKFGNSPLVFCDTHPLSSVPFQAEKSVGLGFCYLGASRKSSGNDLVALYPKLAGGLGTYFLKRALLGYGTASLARSTVLTLGALSSYLSTKLTKRQAVVQIGSNTISSASSFPFFQFSAFFADPRNAYIEGNVLPDTSVSPSPNKSGVLLSPTAGETVVSNTSFSAASFASLSFAGAGGSMTPRASISAASVSSAGSVVISNDTRDELKRQEQARRVRCNIGMLVRLGDAVKPVVYEDNEDGYWAHFLQVLSKVLKSSTKRPPAAAGTSSAASPMSLGQVGKRYPIRKVCHVNKYSTIFADFKDCVEIQRDAKREEMLLGEIDSVLLEAKEQWRERHGDGVQCVSFTYFPALSSGRVEIHCGNRLGFELVRERLLFKPGTGKNIRKPKSVLVEVGVSLLCSEYEARKLDKLCRTQALNPLAVLLFAEIDPNPPGMHMLATRLQATLRGELQLRRFGREMAMRREERLKREALWQDKCEEINEYQQVFAQGQRRVMFRDIDRSYIHFSYDEYEARAQIVRKAMRSLENVEWYERLSLMHVQRIQNHILEEKFWRSVHSNYATQQLHYVYLLHRVNEVECWMRFYLALSEYEGILSLRNALRAYFVLFFSVPRPLAPSTVFEYPAALRAREDEERRILLEMMMQRQGESGGRKLFDPGAGAVAQQMLTITTPWDDGADSPLNSPPERSLASARSPFADSLAAGDSSPPNLSLLRSPRTPRVIGTPRIGATSPLLGPTTPQPRHQGGQRPRSATPQQRNLLSPMDNQQQQPFFIQSGSFGSAGSELPMLYTSPQQQQQQTTTRGKTPKARK